MKIQVENNNGGFVKSYEQSLARNREKYRYPPGLDFDPTLVMGYQEAGDVPVYAYLARNTPSAIAGLARCPAPPGRTDCSQ